MDQDKIWVEASLFRCFLYFFHRLFSSPPPFLCRLEFISNQRASRELQLLITYSFAFLHINDCRVLVGFLPQWFKGTSVLWGGGKMARGKAPSLSNPPLPFLMGTGQNKEGWGVLAWGIWNGWGVVRGDNRGAQVKGQCPLST